MYPNKKPPQTLTEAEQAALLRVTKEHVRGYRDHLLYSFALGTGMRLNELLSLNIEDLLTEDGRIRTRITIRPETAKFGKGREIFLPEGLFYKLQKYLRWKREQGQSMSPDAPLFISNRERRLSRTQAKMGFKVWQRRAGFDRFYRFHALRHTACTNHLRLAGDLRKTQIFAGHADPRTTALYTHPSGQEMLESVRDLPC